jgi:hypothetical protein
MKSRRNVADQIQPMKNLSAIAKPSVTSSDVIADWLALFGSHWGPITEELVAFYQTVLGEIPPLELHEAFLKVSREADKFRPSPGAVYKAWEEVQRAKRLEDWNKEYFKKHGREFHW